MALVAEDGEAEAESVLSHRMVVLIGCEGGAAVIPKYGAPTDHRRVTTEHSTLSLTEVHLQGARSV